MFRESPHPPGFATFVDVLRRWAEARPDDCAFTFLTDGEEQELSLTYAQLDRRAQAIAVALREVAQPGDRALMLYAPGMEFVEAFFGCLYAGVIAVPAYPPHARRRDHTVQRICSISDDATAAVALTTADLLPTLEPIFDDEPSFQGVRLFATDESGGTARSSWQLPEISAETLAFLQYTSGSTGRPKGVMVSHGNLLHNEEMLKQAFASCPETTIVSWLPLFHDMGLIGNMLHAVYTGAHCVLMAPVAFLQRPARWLEAITRYGGRIAGGPNFAYELCAQKVTDEELAGLDLSSWDVAFNGAEPVRFDTLKRFAKRFGECGFRPETMWPCYGLAEATLFVSAGERTSRPNTLSVDSGKLLQGEIRVAEEDSESAARLVSCGHCWLDQSIRIVDPETRLPCPPGRVGEIWIAGPHIAGGYWRRPDASQETFAAHLADSGDGPFLRTGDLGFLEGDELYVTGRLKDLIIIRGGNHYPQDVEYTVEKSHTALRPGCGVAFSVDARGEERLVVCHELSRESRKLTEEQREEIFHAIRRNVAEQHGLEVYAICLLKVGRLPKTSSGKLQRRACRAGFLEDELDLVARWTQQLDGEDAAGNAAEPFASTHTPAESNGRAAWREDEIRAWLIRRLSEKLHVDPAAIDTAAPFADFAIDSKEAVLISGDLQRNLGRPLPATLLYEYPTIDHLSEHLAASDKSEAATAHRNGQRVEKTVAADEPIAVVGIGCRFPGANGPAGFWRLLCDGVDAIRDVPADRWDAQAFYDSDPGAPGKMNTRWGGFLDGVDQFDPQFFGIAPREAARMDPQQRLLLEVAWEALADAGVPPNALTGTPTGVFVGISSNDYGRLQLDDERLCDTYVGTGSALSITANRLSYLLNLSGPSLAVDTACSSSLVAVHLACRSIREGASSVALACGVNLILSPLVTANFSKGGFMSPTGRCKAFSAEADGYVRSEGAGAVVLKPLKEALADGDPIYAVLRGSAVNQDGRSNGLTAPSREAQENVLRLAYQSAKVDPRDVQYIEAHGTGTLLGDPIEARALGAVVGARDDAAEPCRLGSVKSNIGHLESAAGIAGLIKVALSLRHGMLPPSLHGENLNPHIEFDALHLRLQREVEPWRAAPALAGVSSFGFGGTNVHVVLEGPPAEEQPPAAASDATAGSVDSSQAELIPLSAHTPEALKDLASSVKQYIEQAGAELSLADVGYTARVRRGHLPHRLAVLAENREELVAGLEAFLADEAYSNLAAGQAASKAAKTVFVFSGQGPQHAGMACGLLDRYPAFREEVQQCDQIVRSLAGWSIIEELRRPEETSRLEQTEFAQPTLFALQAGLVALWRSLGVIPAAVIGHSSGEVAAAYAAGALSRDDALRLIVLRGRSMQAHAGAGKMAAVGLSECEARELCEHGSGRISIGAVNSPKSVTLSGEWEGIDQVAAELEARGAFCRVLRGNVAFHSPQMEPVADELRRELAGLRPGGGNSVAIYSTVTGKQTASSELTAEYWACNARQPVRFGEAVQHILADGYELFVELGPHPVLAASVEESARGAEESQTTSLSPPAPRVFPSLRRQQDDAHTLKLALAGLHVCGAEVDLGPAFPNRGRVIPLPAYAWQRERYWIDVDGPPARSWLAAEGDATVHPLLGRRHAASAQHGVEYWESEIDRRRLSELGEYRLGEAALAPPALLLELLLAATRQEFARDGKLEICELTFDHPLLLGASDRRQLQIHIAHRGASEGEIRIVSRGAQGGPWTVHARGQVRRRCSSSAAAGGPLDSRSLVPGETATTDGEDYYARLRSRGVDCGPRLRGLARIWRNNGHAVAEMTDEGTGSAKEPSTLFSAASLDACFQATGLVCGGEEQEPLYLPTRIERLTLLPTQDADSPNEPGCRLTVLAETLPEGDSSVRVRLLDAQGEIVGVMSGLQVRLVKASELEPATAGDPGDWLYRLAWKPLPAHRQAASSRAAACIPEPDELADALSPVVDRRLADLAKHRDVLAQLDRLSYYYAVEALDFCGWHLRRGDRVTAEQLFERLSIAPPFRRLFGRLLQILEDEGVLGKVGPAHWVVAKQPELEPAASLQTQLEREHPACDAELTLLGRCGPRLADVLRGRCDPLSLIFPEGSTELAQRVYEDSPFARGFNELVCDSLRRVLAEVPEDRPLRVLEIGAGTGGTTSSLLPLLQGRDISYTFTDITHVFLSEAKQRFAEYDFIDYRLLDVERDPQSQGFAAGQFDLVVASNVLHATKDLRLSLGHVREMLAPGGMLLLLEITSPQRWLDLVFGLTEGWWRFEDFKERPSHPLVSRFHWRYLFEQVGFGGAVALPNESLDSPQAVLLAQTSRVPAKPTAEAAEPWLILGDRTGLAEQLASALSLRGETAIVTRSGERYARLDDATFELCFDSAAQWQKCFEEAFGSEGSCRGVITLSALDCPREDEVAVEQAAAAVERALSGNLHLIKQVVRRDWRRPPRFWFVTRGAQPAGETPVENVGQAALWGFGRVLAKEHAEHWGGLIDLDPADALPHVAALLAEWLVEKHDEDQLAFRGSRRLTARLERTAGTSESVTFRPDGAYLITGGFGALGIALAEWMVEQGARRLILLGRTVLPPREAWPEVDPDSPASGRIEGIRRLERLGASVHPVAADVADETQLQQSLERYRREGWPPICGVVHAAGLMQDTALLDEEMTSVRRTLGPKVLGAWHLDRLLADEPLEWVVHFASAASLFGQQGQAAYAAANSVLDALAHARPRRGTPTITIDWGAFANIGLMRAGTGGAQLVRRLALQGIEPIPLAAAPEIVGRLLRQGASQTVVMPIDWKRFIAAGASDERSSLFRDLAAEASQLAGEAIQAGRSLDRAALLELTPSDRGDHLLSDLQARLAEVLGTSAARLDVRQPMNLFGIDSLMAVQLKNNIDAAFGTDVPVVCFLRDGTLAELAEDVLAQATGEQATDVPALSAAEQPEREFPLSRNQQAFWFFDQLLPGGMGLNTPTALRIRAPIDSEALRRALARLADRHPALRTTFAVSAQGPMQTVHESVPVPLQVFDAAPWSEDELRAHMLDAANRAFDLERGPIYRVVLYRLGADDSILLLSVDHIVDDFWSLTVLARDLGELYRAEAEQDSPELAPLPLTFADYVRWHEALLASPAGERHWDYWKQKLAPPLPMLDLPADRPRPAVQSFEVAAERLALTPGLSTQVREFCERQGVTLYTVLLAAYQLLLHRYSEQDDLLVGTVMAGRNDPRLSHVVGYFINPVALRSRYRREMSFADFLQEARATVLEAMDHQDFPITEVSQRLGIERDRSRSPLFETFFVLQRSQDAGDKELAVFALGAPGAKVTLGGLPAESVELDRPVGQFDLTLMMAEMEDRLVANWTYATDLFEADTIRQMADDLALLLRRLVETPQRRVDEVDLRGLARTEERHRWHGKPTVDIENVLLAHPAVDGCAVRSERDEEGKRQLVAYVVSGSNLTAKQLTEHAQGRLDEARLPAAYLFVSRLPYTSGGGLDEGALQRLPVIEEPLAEKWEAALRESPEVEQAAVLADREQPPLSRTHVGDVVPGWNRFSESQVDVGSDAAAEAAETTVAEETAAENVSAPTALADGGPIHWPADAPSTLAESLARSVREAAEHGITFVQADGTHIEQTYPELLADAERVLAGLRRLGLAPQDKVIFQLERNEDFLPAFWACVLGGFVPAPVSIAADYRELNSAVTKLRNAWELLDRPLILTGSALVDDIRGACRQMEMEGFRVQDVTELRSGEPDRDWHASSPEDTALLLLTSGSTGTPKAVMLSHRNLLARSAGTAQHNGFTRDDVSLSWMPLDHVGAIVYFHLRDVYLGCRQVHVPTSVILENPLRWLDLLEQHRATATFAPNFAYGLVNSREGELAGRGWDLSSLRFALNGGEAIVAKTARRFVRLLEPFGLSPAAMTPAWGMSETSSGVTYGDRFRLETTSDSDQFVELGPPLPGVALRVVDVENNLLPEGQIGRLQVRGETVTSGYYGQPELNSEIFTPDGWFVTGDLAMIRDGRMTITGREKDVIIINGVNFYSHEIEAAIEEIDGVEVSYTAACGIRIPGTDTDRLAIFCHLAPADAGERRRLLGEIRARLARQFGLTAQYLVPVAKEAIPKTAIGKIQRSQLAARFLAGEFEDVLRTLELESGEANTLPRWFYRRRWRPQRQAAATPLDADARVLLLTGGGKLAGRLCSKLEERGAKGIEVRAGAEFSSGESFTIAPNHVEHYERLVEKVESAGPITHVVDLGFGADQEEPGSTADNGVGDMALLWLAQAVARRRSERSAASVRMLAVAHGTQACSDEEAIDASRSALPALLNSLPQDLPWFDTRHVDLPATDEGLDAALLLDELSSIGKESEVAYRDGQRLVPVLQRVELPVAETAQVPLKRGEMYLITGGLGGIGSELARMLLTDYEAKVLLLGRTSLDGEAGGERRAILESLCRLPGDVAYEAVDVTDSDRLAEAVQSASRRWDTSLDGVFHLAGSFRERALLEETPESLTQATAAKLQGSRNLAAIVRRHEASLFVGFSSVNSFFGGGSVGAYAAANRALESVCHELRRTCPGVASFSLAWSMWHERGMSRDYALAELSRSRGFEPIGAAEGVHSLLAALAYGGELLIGLHGGNRNVRRFADSAAQPLARLQAYFVRTAAASGLTSLEELHVADRLGRFTECRLTELLELPRTPEGEIDRAALRTGGRSTGSANQHLGPRNETEAVIAGIWREVLGQAEVGVHDNFFQLGGDSILAVQAISKAAQKGLKFTPKQLFQRQTIAELAEVVEQVDGVDARQDAVTGPVPLTPIQHWLFEQQLPDLAHFNMAAMFAVPAEFDAGVAGEVLKRLLVHHDALRTRFVRGETGWEQNCLPAEALADYRPLESFDLASQPEDSRPAAQQETAERLQRELDLEAGRMIRAAYFDYGAQQPGRLLIVIHHLVMDGVSWRVLLEDFQSLYVQLAAGREPELPPKTTSFQRWAEKLVDYAASDRLRSEADFWLREPPGGYMLPTDSGQGENTYGSAETVSVSLGAEETRALLQQVPQAYNTRINDVLLTALARTIAGWTASPAVHLDLEGHGREPLFDDVDLSRTLGWLTSMFPVWLELGASCDPGEQLKAVKEQLRRIPHRGVGYGLLRYLAGDEQLKGQLRDLPEPELSFNYLGQLDQTDAEGSLLKLTTDPTGAVNGNRQQRRHLIDVLAMVHSGSLQMDWVYSRNYHGRQTIERIAGNYLDELRVLIKHCQAPESRGYTPSDLPAARLSQQQLDQFLAAVTRGGKEESE